MKYLLWRVCIAFALLFISAGASAAGIQVWANNAVSTLAMPASSSTTTLSVSSSTAFPSLTGGNWFIATLEHIVSGVVTAQEIVKVTAVSGTTWTVVRGQENTTGVSWSSGDTIALLPTAGGLSQFFQTSQLASPPAIGGTTPAAINTTTLGATSEVVGSPTGGNEGAGTVNAQGLFVNGAAVGSTSSGSFTITASAGLTTTPSATAYWRLEGSTVTLLIPPLSGTSNSTAFTLSGLPSAIQVGSGFGSDNVVVPMAISENNSAYVAGAYAIIAPASSSLSVGLLGVQNGWTASGTKSVAGMITYSIN